MAFCPECGKEVPSGATSCPWCGFALRSAPDRAPAAANRGPAPRLSSTGKNLLRWIAAVAIGLIIFAFVVGSFMSTTTTLATVGSGDQQSAEIVTCHGFGQPAYSTTGPLSIPGYVVSTSRYGTCFFGFYFANGTPLGS